MCSTSSMHVYVLPVTSLYDDRLHVALAVVRSPASARDGRRRNRRHPGTAPGHTRLAEQQQTHSPQPPTDIGVHELNRLAVLSQNGQDRMPDVHTGSRVQSVFAPLQTNGVCTRSGQRGTVRQILLPKAIYHRQKMTPRS